MKLSGISFVITFLFLLVPLIVQILICKYIKGRAGLILPAVAFVISLIYVINIGGNEENWWKLAISTFLTINIATIIYYLIYRHYDKKEKQKDELDKMEIMDM
ncbi:hypothetical protein [uncultured Anaerococcus sp.]|uniref:hypothetical protein n=1 Tax=uncultured Anaerococcus sp. TaxID=293428 RepID=UPI0025FD1B94|nr:hypothetical protein [uncultured Anaerococcus sp.]